jgi:hypothetical protein
MTTLAQALRGELLYIHQTGDVLDSIKNAKDLLAMADELLGEPEQDN